MKPRFVKIQDLKTRAWYHVNIHHIVSISENANQPDNRRWDSTIGNVYTTIITVDGSQYDTVTFTMEDLIRRVARSDTDWSRTMEKLDPLMGH
jgi:hypothetical protein